jgi:hypothetical protein
MFAAQESSTDFMLRHELGERYCHIDAILTKEQSRDIDLDTVTEAAVSLLQQRGEISAQEFLGTKNSEIFLNHVAIPATFYENGVPLATQKGSQNA